jgi:hypothetical protein
MIFTMCLYTYIHYICYLYVNVLWESMYVNVLWESLKGVFAR